MKIKVSEATPIQLDWLVAKCEYPNSQGMVYCRNDQVETAWHGRYSPSTDWSQGGSIIEREDISFRKYHNPKSTAHGTYYAKVCRESGSMVQWSDKRDFTGPTPLIAAMRCYVASKLGGEVEIPEVLKCP